MMAANPEETPAQVQEDGQALAMEGHVSITNHGHGVGEGGNDQCDPQAARSRRSTDRGISSKWCIRGALGGS